MTHYHKYIRKSDPCTTGFAYKGVYETTVAENMDFSGCNF